MVREAVPSDFNAVSALEKQVFTLHFNARPDMFKARQEPFDRAYYDQCLNDASIRIFVFEENGSVLGHCITKRREIKDHALFRDMIILEIDDLCVDEKARGKHIGRQLFDDVKAYALEIGAAQIELMVWGFNKDARGFYEHLGMSERISRMEYKLET